MSIFAQQFAGAILLGVIYANVAVGFSMYFGVLNVIQFAHGDIFMVGAFVGLSVGYILPSAIAIFFVGMVAMGLFGMLFARLLVRPLLTSPELITLLATLAAGQALREAVRIFYPRGSQPKRFPELFPTTPIHLGDVLLRYSQFFIVAIGLIAIVLTALLVERTWLGRSMRAVSQDREAAQMMGVNLPRVISRTFFVASALAAVAATLYGTYYNTITFNMGLSMGTIGFAAAVLGGLGSIYGAVVGGFAFAFMQSFSAGYLPGGSEYADVVAYLMVVLVLVFRPQGILGDVIVERV